MNAAPYFPRSIVIFVCLALLTACQPASPTPVAQDDIQITRITVNETVSGQIIQTKTFDRCNAAGAFAAEVKFSESISETTQKELTLTVTAGAEAGIPELAKAKLEAAVQERFAFIKQNIQGREESVKIDVPAHTRQEYTIIWKETRDEGTIEYTVNGQPKIANYSYRIGLEFDSATGRDIDCSLPTATFVPTGTPVPPTVLITATPQPKTLLDNCIFAKTWKTDSPDSGLLDTASITSDGCTLLDQLGIFSTRGGLHLFKETRNNTVAAGIYTPIQPNSVIEFDIYVNSLSMKFDNVAEVIFAVTPASDRLTARPTTRFKLHLEDEGMGKVIHFMMADAGENNGVRLGTQHYEYGRTYKIRLLLSANQMDVFINGYRINESLELPIGSNVFYVGYNLPVYTEMDVRISNLTIDGLPK